MPVYDLAPFSSQRTPVKASSEPPAIAMKAKPQPVTDPGPAERSSTSPTTSGPRKPPAKPITECIASVAPRSPSRAAATTPPVSAAESLVMKIEYSAATTSTKANGRAPGVFAYSGQLLPAGG